MDTTKVRVGIVDDSEDLRLLLRLTLEADGRFEVTGEAADGEQAIALVVADHPDLLLLDLAMPRMDGMTALELMRRDNPDAPVVLVLSAYPASSWREQAQKAGANDYVQKGGDPAALADTVFDLYAQSA